jgi:hypothetical protein
MVPRKDGELMERVLRWVGQALVIGAITLALDYVLTATLFAQQKRALAEADAGNYVVYLPTPYHHDLIPDRTSTRVWGNVIYPWKTDQWGFRTGTCAPGEADRKREAIFVIGDSFTEALGSSYEDSFVGLMAGDAARQNKAVWNLAVASYSPAIYHRKIRAAAERLGVKPAEIFVFLDLSDIDDDANVYRIAADGTVTTASAPPGRAEADDRVRSRAIPGEQFHDLQVSLRSLPDIVLQLREFSRPLSGTLDRRSRAVGKLGPPRPGGCGRQSRQGHGDLPGVGLPGDARRLPVAG